MKIKGEINLKIVKMKIVTNIHNLKSALKKIKEIEDEYKVKCNVEIEIK